MGLYHQITNFVIKSVCKQIREWEKKGIDFEYISINLSARDFHKENLIERIRKAIKMYNINPSRLLVELTEDALLQEDKNVHEQFAMLNELGIKLALDDFGTGFSTIRYLKELPISSVKIDRYFIQNLPQNDEDQAIVKSIITLSKELNKTVVAEGVETLEQYDLLNQLECHKVQGYLFSKSVPAEVMEKWFQKDTVQPQLIRSRQVDRRKYFRLKLPFALSTKMTIISYNGMKISLGSTEVLLDDIGLGGLRFLSHLRLTPQEKMIYQFKTEILEKEVELNARIVWYKECKDGIFEYGVAFLINESERDQLAALLNQLTLKIRNNPLFDHGKFIKQNPVTYLKHKYMEN